MSRAARADFDVVIVGSGMVGPCLAALLAQDDGLGQLRVAIVEPASPKPPSQGEVDLRVSALSRASQRILAAVDAWDPVQAHSCAYSEMVVWDAASRHDARDALHFSAAETGGPDLGHIAENCRVQWALNESPRLRKLTKLRTALEALDLGEDCARLTLADGRRVSAALVVGADGGASMTRELAGIARDGQAYPQAAVVAHLRVARPHAYTAWQRFLANGPIALLPLRDGRVSMVWTTTPDEAATLLDAAPETFATRVGEACDHVLGEMTLASERARFPLALWHTREYCRARLALVGDAAHTIHPLAGQGANLGFLDCACLVEVLSKAKGLGEDWSGLRALRRYERWRRSENSLMLGVVDGLNRLFGAQGAASSTVRRLGMSLVAQQPLLRRALIERALGVSGDVPRLVRGAA
ncbi:MAG TPA: UbiH/UbiF/VisC/COQ6 family ubiquinone biosynthesis hydroxylase [Steroidobacteraceae bacterium]